MVTIKRFSLKSNGDEFHLGTIKDLRKKLYSGTITLSVMVCRKLFYDLPRTSSGPIYTKHFYVHGVT